MAEAFSNKLTRAAGIVSTSSSGAIGITTTIITGISTVGVAVSDLVVNQNVIAGTKVTGYGDAASQVVIDRASTNTAAVSSASVSFLGMTTAYTASDKSILIGGTFANNTDSSVNLTVEIHDASAGTQAALASKIPVPNGSSFVISDAGKTVLETSDEVRVFCDSSNAIDVNLSILTGVN